MSECGFNVVSSLCFKCVHGFFFPGRKENPYTRGLNTQEKPARIGMLDDFLTFGFGRVTDPRFPKLQG